MAPIYHLILHIFFTSIILWFKRFQLKGKHVTVLLLSGESVATAGQDNPMPLCDHEEADSRIIVHIADAIDKGAKTILVRTVDTDVIVIIIGVFFALLSKCSDIDIWVAFGSGKNFQNFSINKICGSLGQARCTALPMYHAFSGCDTTSQFLGKGKKSSWEAWNAFPEVTDAFLFLAEHPFEQIDSSSDIFKLLERYVCVLYDKTSMTYSVNELRQELFSRKSNAIENIPPTQVGKHVEQSCFECLQAT